MVKIHYKDTERPRQATVAMSDISEVSEEGGSDE